MNVFSSHHRFPATVLTAVLLTVVTLGYSRLTAPWLRVEPQRRMAVRWSTGSSHPVRSPDFQSLAARWFPDDAWVHSAGKRFRDQQRYLYFNSFELENQNHSMMVKPIAMLWLSDDDEEPPTTITAASAQLDRASAFRLEEGEFGRITSGSLFGEVQVRGPNGLRIEGRNFHVSEKDMKMWSNQPVTFAWEDHTGRAESGVEIKLLGTPDEASGLVSVSDIQSITMLGRVICDLKLSQSDDKPDVPVRINAANGFEYFVPTRTARFSGHPDRELTPANQIVVQQTTESGALDQLFCSQLSLYFQPRVDRSGTDDRRLEIQRIDAEGSRVVFHSPENELTAWMTNLRYNVPQRTLQLWRRGVDPSGVPIPVRIQQRETELFATRIDAVQDDEGRMHLLECRGTGLLRHRDEGSEQTLDARWSEALTWFNELRPRVLLIGDAAVRQPDRDLSLGAERIELTLRPTTPAVTVPGDGPGKVPAPMDLSDLHPEALTAHGEVALKSGRITGTVRRQLSVRFAEKTAEAAAPVQAVSSTESGPVSSSPGAVSPAAPDGEPHPDPDGTTEFSADTLEAVMMTDASAAGRQARLTDVWLKGGVTVDHQAVDPTENFRAEGNVAYAAAGLEGSREIQLFGDPATVVNTDRRIEGQRIDLHEQQREARVEGSGKLTIVVDRGLDGRPLPRPTPLDVYWSRQMTFSGRTAHFVGDIRAVMKDGTTHFLQIQCQGMQVQFTSDVTLDRSRDGQLTARRTRTTSDSEIESITCESLVTVHIDELIAGNLEAVHRAEFSDFHVNLQSGDFHAQGPGWIESTGPDRENKLRVAPEVTARANTPVRTPDNSYVFVRASFIGMLSGNLNTQLARLENHVTGVFGPVRRLGERLVLDAVDTSRLPEQSGVLRCEEMTVAVIPGVLDDHNSFSLTASVNARLESRRFSGDADRITYDHAKQQFILRSDGDTLATVYHRPGHSSEVRSLIGKRFEYYPGRNQLTASQITGVQAAQ